ncbi:MAG: helix-turn-helix domain-containing protein [Lachnospiraceae bacterium]|nr:helix-turn-helix domain-containing protein [Lachnospiraceae bacterium]MBR5993275.1 helix-turn-helix domain-containing protein [Lachnospiraceae bacterium]
MNAIKALRSTTGMSQNKFALYLGIPVANIQHWEQGKTNPPDYVTSLISRVMKSDGYIEQEYTTAQIDMLRQTQATLAIENLSIGKAGVDAIGKMLKGEISRAEYQKMLKENYKANGKH